MCKVGEVVPLSPEFRHWEIRPSFLGEQRTWSRPAVGGDGEVQSEAGRLCRGQPLLLPQIQYLLANGELFPGAPPHASRPPRTAPQQLRAVGLQCSLLTEVLVSGRWGCFTSLPPSPATELFLLLVPRLSSRLATPEVRQSELLAPHVLEEVPAQHREDV